MVLPISVFAAPIAAVDKAGDSWVAAADGASTSSSGSTGSAQTVIRTLYGMLCDSYTASTEPVRQNMAREGRMRQQWQDLIRETRDNEVERVVCTPTLFLLTCVPCSRACIALGTVPCSNACLGQPRCCP